MIFDIFLNNLPLVAADENTVQQIIYNFVGNAIKFTESGTVKVSAKSFVVNSQQFILTVFDTGIGIPEYKFNRIFEFFEQGEESTEREYRGTGLGLAIAKKFV